MNNLSLIAAFFVSLLLGCSDRQSSPLPRPEVVSIKPLLATVSVVPSRFTSAWDDTTVRQMSGDSAYEAVLRMDTAVIERLILVLPDTSLTQIPNPCGSGNFTFGQLAFLLINEIEGIPIASITQMQFDVLDCGALPHGLLEYVKLKGTQFQHQYSAYFHSSERARMLTESSRSK